MTQNNYNSITLKTLTAHQLLSSRENMCELFHLLDDSERQEKAIIREDRESVLEAMTKRLEQLRSEVEALNK